MSIVLVIAMPLVLAIALFAYVRSTSSEREARSELVALLANIATIVGMIVANCAVVYAILQYRTYVHELSKKPNLEVRVTPKQIPPGGFIRYSSPEAEYTEPMKILVDIVNTGEVVGREIFAAIAFSPNVQVLSIDYAGPGFESPDPGLALFMFSNPEHPVPPGGLSQSLMEFTIRIKRTQEQKIDIAGLVTKLEGKPLRMYKVLLDTKLVQFVKTPMLEKQSQ